jgi:hypothetical protein
MGSFGGHQNHCRGRIVFLCCRCHPENGVPQNFLCRELHTHRTHTTVATLNIDPKIIKYQISRSNLACIKKEVLCRSNLPCIKLHGRIPVSERWSMFTSVLNNYVNFRKLPPDSYVKFKYGPIFKFSYGIYRRMKWIQFFGDTNIITMAKSQSAAGATLGTGSRRSPYSRAAY